MKLLRFIKRIFSGAVVPVPPPLQNPVAGRVLDFSTCNPEFAGKNKEFFDLMGSAPQGSEILILRADNGFYDLVSIADKVIPSPVFYQVAGLDWEKGERIEKFLQPWFSVVEKPRD